MKRIIWLPLIIIIGILSGTFGSVLAAPLSEDGKLQVISAGLNTIIQLFADALQAVVDIITVGIAG